MADLREEAHELFRAMPGSKGDAAAEAADPPRVLDVAVPIHEADRLAALLAVAPGPDYEYFRYPNGDHGIASLIGAGARVLLRPFWNQIPVGRRAHSGSG